MVICQRAAELIQVLNLQPHPEGGFFCEIFRSDQRVLYKDDGGERSALTSIYFLLVAGQYSQWHRIKADEVWHFYEGDPLELVWAGEKDCRQQVLGPVGEGRSPVGVVPGGHWQAARPLGEYTLVGCSVAPGFEFAEFELLEEATETSRQFQAAYPQEWERVRQWAV